jgi:hypothetical protein
MPSRADFDLSFDDPDLASRAEALADSALDTFSYGVVQLDGKVRVRFINRVEREFLGLGCTDLINRDYFATVAPRCAGPAIRRHIEAASEPIALDIDTIDDGLTEHRLRIRVRSSSTGGFWLFISRAI